MRKTILIVAALLCCASGASAQNSAYSSHAWQAFGYRLAPINYPIVYVCPVTSSGQPCSPLATLYSNSAGTASLPNPLTGDYNGNFSFYVAPGSYLIQVASGAGLQPAYSYAITIGNGSGTDLLPLNNIWTGAQTYSENLPINFVQGGGSCAFGSPSGINWQVCVNGTDLQWEHPGSGGSGRFHVDSDFLVGPPGTSTASGNFNSFAWDNQGEYWDGASEFVLWEMAEGTTPTSGSPINSRESLYPIFQSACTGCTADMAIGGTGVNPAVGNPVAEPYWDFLAYPNTDNFTMTFSHTGLTSNVTGMPVIFTGSWVAADCPVASSTVGLFNLASCGTGGGGSVNVNGSAVSSPNFNGTTPAAGSGFTNATFQVSGSSVSVEVPTSSATPGGTNTAVQFNNAGALAGDTANFNFNDTTHALAVTGPMTASSYICTGTGPGCSTWTLGSGSQANASFYYAESGSGANNTNAGFFWASASPANAFNSFLFPCQAAGSWCTSGTTPAADSAKTLALHGGVNAQTLTTYTIANTDEDGLTTFNNAGAIAVTLACPSVGPPVQFANGWREAIKDLGAGTVTITVSGCTITPLGSGTAATTATFATGASGNLYSDGTNYQVVQ